MNLSTILVPVDFTACSRAVALRAASLAERVGARLVLHHAAPLPPGLPPETRVFPQGSARSAEDWALAEARTHLERLAAEVRSTTVEVAVRCDAGPVVPTILAAVREVGADFVVMGTHGRSGVARWVLGSVAEGVTRESPVPVMLIRREPRPECGRASCAWCSLDGRSDAERALGAEALG